MHSGESGGNIEARNTSIPSEQLDILPESPPPGRLFQVVGDLVGHGFVGQQPPGYTLVDAHDMEAVARLYRDRRKLPLFQIEQEGLHFRHRVAARKLTQPAVIVLRIAGGMGSRQFAETLRLPLNVSISSPPAPAVALPSRRACREQICAASTRSDC